MRKIYLSLICIMVSVSIHAQRDYDMDPFLNAFETYDFDASIKYLDENVHYTEGRNRVLWLLNQGVAHSLSGNYERSNQYLEDAYIYFEDIYKKLGDEALAYLLNPTKREYRGEDVEVLMIHYYKAFNYLMLNDYEKAYVEVRRMDIKLNQLNDKYNKENKFQKDAFIHLLMGLIYEANHQHNDAFIAYRNAYDIYEKEYPQMFGLSAPNQLKMDMIRTARMAGLFEESLYYEKEFGYTYDQVKDPGNVVAFWNNGLGPVKDQTVLHFMFSQVGDDIVFVDQTTGDEFPFAAAAVAAASALVTGSNSSVKMAYPVYRERGTVFSNAYLVNNGQKMSFEKCEDVNGIAFKSLEDRKAKELSELLLRFAIKQSAKEGGKKLVGNLLDKAGIGFLSDLSDVAIDVAVDATEKADIRNWKTLPNSIFYTRMNVPEGSQKVQFMASNALGKNTMMERDFHIEAEKTYFTGFSTLEYKDPAPLEEAVEELTDAKISQKEEKTEPKEKSTQLPSYGADFEDPGKEPTYTETREKRKPVKKSSIFYYEKEKENIWFVAVQTLGARVGVMGNWGGYLTTGVDIIDGEFSFYGNLSKSVVRNQHFQWNLSLIGGFHNTWTYEETYDPYWGYYTGESSYKMGPAIGLGTDVSFGHVYFNIDYYVDSEDWDHMMLGVGWRF